MARFTKEQLAYLEECVSFPDDGELRIKGSVDTVEGNVYRVDGNVVIVKGNVDTVEGDVGKIKGKSK